MMPLPKLTAKKVLPNLTVKKAELLLRYCVLINMPSPSWCDGDLLKKMFDKWANVTDMHLQYGIVEAAVFVVTVPPPAPDPELTAEPMIYDPESADWPDTDESAIYESAM